jgi:zinc protease
MKLRHRDLRVRVLLIAALVTLATTTSAQTIHLPPHEKVVLKNGLTVLLLEKRGVPIVSFYGVVKTGSLADPPGQEGLAAITAGLLRKGTKARSAQQFSADLDFIGGSFTAEASADFTGVYAEFLTKDLAKGLDLFSDALLRPTFPKEEADKLLAQSLDAVKGAKDDPQQVLATYY